MTTAVPAPQCPLDQVGLCARCQAKAHRYGHNGNPLCSPCLAAARAQQAKKGRRARVQ
ncbi:hypothetical protein ACH4Q7_23020 [Streptomyces roseolus]|uniref:hypothetical protein n=1 Tax=Streptomyces roseolus TaxID=67358 RepID=UPI0037A7A579